MLKGKCVVLGVCGSISAYKIANLASMLVKQHCDVHVVMTKNATQFITPTTFETLTGNECFMDSFDPSSKLHVPHIALAKMADLFFVVPASADVIGKLANGIADDMLTSSVLACTCPKMISPAMNTNMYRNPIVQDNLNKLERFGWEVITPDSGFLACRDEGEGKLPSEKVLLDHILHAIAYPKDLAGKKVLVTAGPTQEKIDPVRYITNHSSGKMGYEIARAAMLRGAEVTLVSGVTALEPVPFVKMVPIVSAEDMFQAVTQAAPEQDIIIKAAAVADYRPAQTYDEKVKKTDGDMSIPLERTKDILLYLGEHRKEGQYLCGFSMETQNMLENSRAKLNKKHIDMIAANNLKVAGSGFGTDTNRVTLITAKWEKELELLSKAEVAHCLLDEIVHEME